MSIRNTLFSLPLIALLFLCAPYAVSSASDEPPWPNTCGDGRVDLILEDFDSPDNITIYKADPSIPDPDLDIVDGCNGHALSFGYDLNNASLDGQSWIVLQWPTSTSNLSGNTHIRLAMHGSNLHSYETVEVKLRTDDKLYAVPLKSMTDLPVWRPIYIDLRELTGPDTIDLQNVTHIEIGIVRCLEACEVSDVPGVPIPTHEYTGTLFLDEFALVDLADGPHRLIETDFEKVTGNRNVAAKAANALYNKIATTKPAEGLVPAWFEEANPNYNSYALAEALLVFIYEYQQSHETKYLDAARDLATKLLSLQITEGTQSGAWYTSYNSELAPPYRALSEDGNETPEQCNGNESVVNNIDACEWVGNVGWVLIALRELQSCGLYNDPSVLAMAINQGATWLIGQMGRDEAYPYLISHGIEGNISAYFGLLTAGKTNEAKLLGEAIFEHGWDTEQRRMKVGIQPTDVATAMDVTGSWGVTFLRSINRREEALAAQGYAATVLRTSSLDGATSGYGDIAGPFTVATEFTAQAAAAGIKDADFVMQQLYPLQLSEGPHTGAFSGAIDHWYGGSLPPWNTTMHGVSPTAWVYFASSGIDPLLNILRRPNVCILYLPVITR